MDGPPPTSEPPPPEPTATPWCSWTIFAPVLQSPANGAVIYATSTAMSWQNGAVGTCPGTAYDAIYIWDSSWTLVMNAAIPAGGSSYYWGGPYGTYYWEIVTYNASGPAAYSPIWSFTLAAYCPSIVSASPATATAGDTVNFSITFSHPGGAAQLNRGYFGLTNACSCNPGEAYCSNFERQLARSLALYDSAAGGGVGTIGTGAACSGGTSGACPWTNFSGSAPGLTNASGNATVNHVSFVDIGNQRTYTWNVTLGRDFPAGTYNYYAMASDISGNWQDCGGARWDKLSTIQVIAPLAASLTPRYSSLVLMAPDLGLPVQTLDGTISGGTPPYNTMLYVEQPDSTQIAYHLPSGASLSFGPDEAGNPDFGTTQKGTWRAWMTVTDSASHTATSPTAVWNVTFYPVHETP